MGIQRLFLPQTVLEAARERMRWVFDEFEHVLVSFSGGKDSTVILHLALEEAERRGRLPLPVFFLDQEAEWEATIDYVRSVMADPRVDARWLQVPFRLFNATSAQHPWLHCWDPKAEGQWMRPKEPGTIQRNVYGTDRFKELFKAYLAYHYPAVKVATLTGIRCEESPTRAMGMTTSPTYKGVTWGARDPDGKRHYHFAPIYDWSYTDVWKAIHAHGWRYCSIYDRMYAYGVVPSQMRVSSLHHVTALIHLTYLQELEPHTWEAMTRRLAGINTVGHLRLDFLTPKELPSMFKTWQEYRDHLLPRLIEKPEDQAKLRKQFERLDRAYGENEMAVRTLLWRTECAAIIRNDTAFRMFNVFVTQARTKPEARQHRFTHHKRKLVVTQVGAPPPVAEESARVETMPEWE